MSMPRFPSTESATAALFVSRTVVVVAIGLAPSLSQRIDGSVCCDVGLDHLSRIDNAIEFRRADRPEFQRGLLERQVMIQGVVRDLGGLVVADHGAECG